MPLVPLPSQNGPFKHPNDYAIVVGINHYLAGINALKGPINDCELFCRWLVEPSMGGLNPANVSQFVSAGPRPEPMRNQIEDLLTDFFERANQGWSDGRRLYLFFAGHGLTKPPPNQQDCGLVMADARPILLRGLLGEVAANGMRLTGLFKEVMLVMDCCAEVSGPAELLCHLPNYGDPTLKDLRPYLHIHAAAWNATTAERELPDPLDPTEAGEVAGGADQHAPASPDDSFRCGRRDHLGLGQDLHRCRGSRRASGRVRRRRSCLAPTPMVFGKPQVSVVNVKLRNGAARFQVRDGDNFAVVQQPRAAPATVKLRPGIWLFDSFDAAGVVTASQSVSVREGGVDVFI